MCPSQMTDMKKKLKLMLKAYNDTIKHYEKLVNIVEGVEDKDTATSLLLSYAMNMMYRAFSIDPVKTVFWARLILLRMELAGLQMETKGFMEIAAMDMRSKSDEELIDKIVEMTGDVPDRD